MSPVGSVNTLSDGERTLVELGFSEYEARTYLGLVGRTPVTGYAVAKATRVPMPKVYETLDRLAQRGIAFKVADDPALWVALPPEQILSALQRDFDRRLLNAKLNLAELIDSGDGERVVPFWGYRGWPTIRAKASELVESAGDRLYVSGRGEDLQDLAGLLREADDRGVRVHLLTFGPLELQLQNGEVVRHASTDGVVFPRHRTRHLAIAVDDSGGMWALAPAGDDWAAISVAENPMFPALVRGYIRHDIFVQQMYIDLPQVLEERYGPGLQGLFSSDLIEPAALSPQIDPGLAVESGGAIA
jgi:sugar-specific transcriptional regulator TrmB